MPDYAPLRMCFQIKASYHHPAFFKVSSDRECKQILIDLALLVKLLNKEGSSCSSGYGSQPNNTVTCHSRKSLLVSRRDKGHTIDALIRLGTKTDQVGRTMAPYMTTSVAYLTELLRNLFITGRLGVLEVVCRRTR